MQFEQQEPQNYAFVDGQNVYLATTTAEDAWKIDLQRFRTYLREKLKLCGTLLSKKILIRLC